MWLVVNLLLCTLAHADAALALQPAIGVGTAIDTPTPTETTPTPTASSSLPRESFVMVPALRLGIDFESWRLLAYGTNTNAGVQSQQNIALTRVGILVEPVLWQSGDSRVGIYLVGGGGVVVMDGSVGGFVETGPTFLLGLGGWYAVHPNFALGLELAMQPEAVSLDSGGLYIGNQTMVSLTGTFIAAERSFPRAH